MVWKSEELLWHVRNPPRWQIHTQWRARTLDLRDFILLYIFAREYKGHSSTIPKALHDILGIHQDGFLAKLARMPSPALHIQPCIERGVLGKPPAKLWSWGFRNKKWWVMIPVITMVVMGEEGYRLCTFDWGYKLLTGVNHQV